MCIPVVKRAVPGMDSLDEFSSPKLHRQDCVSIFSLTVSEAQRIMEVAAKASGADPWDRPAKARMKMSKNTEGSNMT